MKARTLYLRTTLTYGRRLLLALLLVGAVAAVDAPTTSAESVEITVPCGKNGAGICIAYLSVSSAASDGGDLAIRGKGFRPYAGSNLEILVKVLDGPAVAHSETVVVRPNKRGRFGAVVEVPAGLCPCPVHVEARDFAQGETLVHIEAHG